MPRKKKYSRNKKGKGIIWDTIKKIYNVWKEKLWDLNEYLKQKKFAKNLITDEINYWNPIRAISQSFGINKLLQKSLLNAPLRTLEWLGYGKKRKNKKK